MCCRSVHSYAIRSTVRLNVWLIHGGCLVVVVASFCCTCFVVRVVVLTAVAVRIGYLSADP